MGFLDKLFGKKDESKKETKNESKKKQIKKEPEEKINYGTYHSTLSKASSYWNFRRFGWSSKPQFTLFTFINRKDATDALLELSFIHKLPDGSLICDRMMEYGCYEVSDGVYEAIVGGFDLTLDEFKKAEASFTAYGGTLKNHLEPSSNVKACLARNGNRNNVYYKETIRNANGTYEVYEANKAEDAMLFLGNKSISGDSYFICVDTPEGSFAKDYIEIFQEVYTTPHTK